VRTTGARNRACQYKNFRKARSSYSSGEHLNLSQKKDLNGNRAILAG
jgi:hypothetical protein